MEILLVRLVPHSKYAMTVVRPLVIPYIFDKLQIVHESQMVV